MSDGPPQSVYTLDKSDLEQVTVKGQPFARALAVGETMRLPGGQGSLRFDRVARFANFQIARDPGQGGRPDRRGHAAGGADRIVSDPSASHLGPCGPRFRGA